MLQQEAKYNTKTKKGTYNHFIHHGEFANGAKIKNGSATAYGQNLAATTGTSGAKRLLAPRYAK